MSENKSVVIGGNEFFIDRDKEATVMLTPSAFIKMLMLIENFNTEVGWYCVGERKEDSVFLITDVLVYPQTVTKGDIDFDPAEYVQWRMENIEDERFSHIVCHCHSHVNMGVFASPTDIDSQKIMVSQLSDDMFYIFMIWNKSLECHIKIFDAKNKMLYYNYQINITFEVDGEDFTEFLSNARSVVKECRTHQKFPDYDGYEYYGIDC